jgi:hypothetical protein
MRTPRFPFPARPWSNPLSAPLGPSTRKRRWSSRRVCAALRSSALLLPPLVLQLGRLLALRGLQLRLALLVRRGRRRRLGADVGLPHALERARRMWLCCLCCAERLVTDARAVGTTDSAMRRDVRMSKDEQPHRRACTYRQGAVGVAVGYDRSIDIVDSTVRAGPAGASRICPSPLDALRVRGACARFAL